MPRKKTGKPEEPDEPQELDPEVEVFLDVLARIIIRIKTDEARGYCSLGGSSDEPPVVRRKVRSSKNKAPTGAGHVPRTG